MNFTCITLRFFNLARRCRFPNLHSIRSKVYLSGIQPTGVPHIGNYLGFIQNFVKMQNLDKCGENILFIADLHALTTGHATPEMLRRNICELAAALIASGVNDERTIVFQQSRVPECTELAWILSSFYNVNSLQRLPHYREKAERFKKQLVPLGILCYPLLQAADILLYKATHVPVGEDQDQHLNIARELARRFNSKFAADCFPLPEKVFSDVPRVKGLRDPLKKMSKSDTTEWSRILISDSREDIAAKCRRATTDGTREIYYDAENRPGISNLLKICAIFSEQSVEEVVEYLRAQNLDTVQFKQHLAARIDEHLSPIRRRYFELIGHDRDFLDKILSDGNEKARSTAVKNLSEVKRLVGLC